MKKIILSLSLLSLAFQNAAMQQRRAMEKVQDLRPASYKVAETDTLKALWQADHRRSLATDSNYSGSRLGMRSSLLLLLLAANVLPILAHAQPDLITQEPCNATIPSLHPHDDLTPLDQTTNVTLAQNRTVPTLLLGQDAPFPLRSQTDLASFGTMANVTLPQNLTAPTIPHIDRIVPLNKNQTIIALFGSPGSGKGTLLDFVTQSMDFKILSTGNLARREIARGSRLGTLIAPVIKAGGFGPDDAIANLTESWLGELMDGSPIILDGYPRSRHLAELFLNTLKNKYPDHRMIIVFLQVDEDEILKRLSTRLTCSNKACQASYNLNMLKNQTHLVCEKCGHALIRREDDAKEIVRIRLEKFKKNSAEMVDFCAKVGIEVIPLPGQASPKEVFERFKKIIGCILKP